MVMIQVTIDKVVIEFEWLLFMAVYFLGPLSFLVPSIIGSVLTKYSQGDSTWWFIGPVMYIYGLGILSVASLVLLAVSWIMGWEFFSISIRLFGGVELLIAVLSFIFVGLDVIEDRRKYNNAK